MRIRPFNPKTIPKPRTLVDIDGSSVFDLEVGCGVGKFALAYCKAHPKRHLIAMDRSRMRMQKFKQARVSQPHELTSNLTLACEDFDKLWAHQLSGLAFERIFFWYPNPYPKPGQANKRWHRMPIMGSIIESLNTGGAICLATNEAFYAQEAKKFFVQHWQLSLAKEDIYQDALPFEPRTHFEKKYLARGQKIYDLVFTKA